jgi:hypothetical protein
VAVSYKKWHGPNVSIFYPFSQKKRSETARPQFWFLIKIRVNPIYLVIFFMVAPPYPWTITTVHANGTITIQPGNKLERLNIRRVKLFEE